MRKEIDQRTVADITQLFTMSATDLLRRWFENDIFIGLQSVNGIIGTWAGPDAPGTAYVMMHHSVGDIGDGEIASWGYPEGGMGAVGDACRKAAESFGAEVRTNARVERILTKEGRVTGVALAGGEELARPDRRHGDPPEDHASCSSSTSPSCRRGSSSDIRNWKTRSGTVKINLALSELPEFTADPGFDPDIHGGAIQIMDDLDYLERAFQEARFGKAATLPFSDTAIPTVFDKTLAPEGVHVMSMFTQWVPAEWADEDGHEPELEAYADRLIERVNDVAPNFKNSVMHRQIIGPTADAGRVGADRRQHLPRRADGGSAVPHAPGARLRRLPHADPRAVPGLERDPRRRRRDGHARPPLRPRDHGRPGGAEAQALNR